MGLKFRRGSTAQQSGSLAFGEPYVNTTLGTLIVGGATGDIILGTTGTGSTGNFGPISGSGLDITGNANIAGNLTLGGAITIGDASSDTVNVVASLSSSLIPQTTNVFDLGSATKFWRDLYISTGSIKMVNPANNQVVTTITAVTGGGIQIGNVQITTASIAFVDNAGVVTQTVAQSSSVGTTSNFTTTSSFNAYTSSNDTTNTTQTSRLDQLSTASGSLNTSVTNLNTTTASLNTSVSNLNTFSGSENTKSTTLQTYTASVNQTTSSLNQYTASANAWSGTIDTRFNTLQQVTSSLQSATGSLFVSASRMTASIFAQEGRITYLEGIAFGGIDLSAQFSAIQQITSSLHSYTSSANIRFTNIEAATSSYETKGRGIVSGSSQILGGSGVWSGSAQMPVGVVSGSSQITYTNISSIPAGIVSGAAQVTPLLPNGVISGSSQISSLFEPIASSTRTLISGSSQVLGGSGIHSGSYTGNNNIVSSSSQITYASISSIPAGIVSGSSQILGGSGLFSSSVQIGNYVATITGTTNQITVAGSGLNNAGVTLSTPQNIHSAATPTFAGLTINGAITATGDITAYYTSDERLKENIQPIQNALSKVETISGNEYNWKEGFDEIHTKKGNDIGVIAQEIQKILPQAVIERDNGYLGVNYEKIIPLLIESIKELSAKVKELENK